MSVINAGVTATGGSSGLSPGKIIGLQAGLGATGGVIQTALSHLLNMRSWRKQNEYNLPSAQMQRLKDAGLNPNLVYGKGTSTLASQPSATSVGDFRPPNIANVLQTYQDMKVKQAQVNNINAQTGLALERKLIEGYKRNQLGLQTALLNRRINTLAKYGEGDKALEYQLQYYERRNRIAEQNADNLEKGLAPGASSFERGIINLFDQVFDGFFKKLTGGYLNPTDIKMPSW